MKDNKNMKGTKQFSTKQTDFKQEGSKELGYTVPTGYVSPEKLAKEAYNQQGSQNQNKAGANFNQEASKELNVNKVMNAGKDNKQKNKQ